MKASSPKFLPQAVEQVAVGGVEVKVKLIACQLVYDQWIVKKV